MAARATQTDSEKELRDAFAVFDRDGGGTIDADEIRKVMKSLGDNLTDEEIEVRRRLIALCSNPANPLSSVPERRNRVCGEGDCSSSRRD